MTDQVLNILKFVLLGLLYLFFARVLWAVWSEVRTPSRRPVPTTPRPAAPRPPVHAPAAATPAAGLSRKDARQARKEARGRASRLVILEPDVRRGLTVSLGGEILIGRDPGCTITIDDDAYVSQRHVRIYDYDGQPMVEDLASTNGTFHNGAKLLGAKLLHPGDRIQVGTTVLEAQ
jgi:pSer/pThr/pTyr-binding forkhead associated (FHA) protein